MNQNLSILTTVKKQLGITEDYVAFDEQILVSINTTMAIIRQLGAGPGNALSVVDKTTTWSALMNGNTNLDELVSYIYLRVRLEFDPPTNSFVVDSMQNQIRELEYRICVECDTVVTPDVVTVVDDST